MMRRSMSSASSHSAALAQLPRKRPRTSWGKPHANPALLVCSSLFLKLEEAVSSTTSACDIDEDYAASTCNMLTVTSPGEATSFVKTEPLQHLVAVKLEEVECYDDGPLHQLVPTFFPAIAEAHLLTVINSTSAADHNWVQQRPACLYSSFSRPVSPLNSSSATDEFSGEPLSSSVTDDFSGDDMHMQHNWDQGFNEESCEFLSEQIYKMEKDMSCIMGAGVGQQLHMTHHHHHHAGLFGQRNGVKAAGIVAAADIAEGCGGHAQFMATTETRLLQVLKKHGEEQQQVNADCSTALPSLGEEEYRIDLVDFEPDVEVGDEQLHAECYKQMQVEVGRKKAKVVLSLDYEEVMSAWSDKGSLFTDGSSPSSSSPEDYPLDLTDWESAFLSVQRWIFPEEARKVILISPPHDGTCVGDDADADGAGTISGRERNARVLRYREKRRTRLFSKKIRYEVRKFNAERRPRMKGRFIKRSVD